MKNNKFLLKKFDIFILGFILVAFLSVGVAIKYVLQKDTFVVVEMLASGGEWWWGTPPPFYWNVSALQKGAVENDIFGKPIVEILDIIKLDNDDRKLVWIQARIKVQRNVRTNSYDFRQTKVEIGRMLTIAPNHIQVVGNVVGIEGVGQLGKKETRIVTVVAYEIRQWLADALIVGDVIKDDKGEIVAEILEKKDEPDALMTTDMRGETFLRYHPFLREVTLKIRLAVRKENNDLVFNYYQNVRPGDRVRLQFNNAMVGEFTVQKIEEDVDTNVKKAL